MELHSLPPVGWSFKLFGFFCLFVCLFFIDHGVHLFAVFFPAVYVFAEEMRLCVLLCFHGVDFADSIPLLWFNISSVLCVFCKLIIGFRDLLKLKFEYFKDN
jgi:hypothetical protein